MSDEDGSGISSLRVFMALGMVVSLGATGGAYYVFIHQPQQTLEQAEQTEGTVISAQLEERSIQNEPDLSYEYVLTYNYTHNGTAYTNDNVRPGPEPLYDSKSRARKEVGEYAPGDSVTVYVDPADPNESFIHHAGTEPVDVFFTVFPLLFFLFFLKNYREAG